MVARAERPYRHHGAEARRSLGTDRAV